MSLLGEAFHDVMFRPLEFGFGLLLLPHGFGDLSLPLVPEWQGDRQASHKPFSPGITLIRSTEGDIGNPGMLFLTLVFSRLLHQFGAFLNRGVCLKGLFGMLPDAWVLLRSCESALYS